MKSLRLLAAKPSVKAVLDPEFSPCIVGSRRYQEAVAATSSKDTITIAVERENNLVCRRTVQIFRQGTGYDDDTLLYVDRLIKFVLWARGGWKIYLSGPDYLGRYVKQAYSPGGSRKFDADLMSRVYERPFETALVGEGKIPQEKESGASLGGHLDGYRVGFDLGASDYKIAAINEGKEIFAKEFPWNPKDEPDPSYHYGLLKKGIEHAASKLPRLDAIGGSSAGVFINNRVMVASLFRAIAPERFEREVKGMFVRLGEEFKVPLEVVNDGDVTALAGAMSLGSNSMLGVAMGSSQAAGYLSPEGKILGWLNELAFAPVDYNPAAAADEWSGDTGVGVMYFSQQAVNKLAANAAIPFPDSMGLPERLKEVQNLMQKGDERAYKIYESIGVYLGYTIPWYAEFYDVENLLVLGRVTSGKGGEVIVDTARRILKTEFAGLAAKVAVHVPDEKMRRVGQAVAAASLPVIR